MPSLSITLLGSMQVMLDDKLITEFTTDKARALLAYLAVEADRPHRRDALSGLLWPNQSQERARRNLRQALSFVRSALGDGEGADEGPAPFLLVDRNTIQFNRESDHWLDVTELVALLDACRSFPLERRRRITFEYVLIDGINDSVIDAHRLAKLLKGMKKKVNLIPLNTAASISLKPPHPDRVLEFQNILISHHITVNIRTSRGSDIAAACGMLAANTDPGT